MSFITKEAASRIDLGSLKAMVRLSEQREKETRRQHIFYHEAEENIGGRATQAQDEGRKIGKPLDGSRAVDREWNTFATCLCL